MPNDGFDTFWTAYRNTKKKAEAQKAWRKLRPDAGLQQQILSAVAWQVVQPDWLKDNRQYQPMAVTYLNQRRWEDEQPVAEPVLSEFALRTMAASQRRLRQRDQEALDAHKG